jgi:F420-non-reducing hydrogenase small subunit
MKVAFYWGASCGGCEIAVLDMNERILELVKHVEIVFWPVAMDVKYNDVEAMPDGHIDITFFNGSIRNSEQEHMAKLLRAKSKTLVAFGSCAHEGCVPGLANLNDAKGILDLVYHGDSDSSEGSMALPTPCTQVREGTLNIPVFHDTVRTLGQTVDVDYYLPGCPPPVVLINNALDAILKGDLPKKGSVLAPMRAVCDQCPRKRENKKISSIHRVHEIVPEPERCLMEQGIAISREILERSAESPLPLEQIRRLGERELMLDSRIQLLATRYPGLSPLVDYLAQMRENMVAETLAESALETRLMYSSGLRMAAYL